MTCSDAVYVAQPRVLEHGLRGRTSATARRCWVVTRSTHEVASGLVLGLHAPHDLLLVCPIVHDGINVMHYNIMHYRYASPDGLRWSRMGGAPPTAQQDDTKPTGNWDPQLQKYSMRAVCGSPWVCRSASAARPRQHQTRPPRFHVYACSFETRAHLKRVPTSAPDHCASAFTHAHLKRLRVLI